MKKFLVLTSNIGDKNILKDPKQKFDNCDYLAFVDKEYDVNIWKQMPAFKYSLIDNFTYRRNAKPYKILSSLLFKEYEYVIWCDSNKNLNCDPEEIIKKYGDFDLLLFKHPERQCLFQEMKICAKWGLDDINLFKQQAQFYFDQGMPTDYGLFEMTIFIKKNSPKIMNFDLMWWEQISKFSSRDQCSLTYCLWKSQGELNIKTFEGHANPYGGGNAYFYQN
jgi:hypothetical protein